MNHNDPRARTRAIFPSTPPESYPDMAEVEHHIRVQAAVAGWQLRRRYPRIAEASRQEFKEFLSMAPHRSVKQQTDKEK